MCVEEPQVSGTADGFGQLSKHGRELAREESSPNYPRFGYLARGKLCAAVCVCFELLRHQPHWGAFFYIEIVELLTRESKTKRLCVIRETLAWK